MVLITSGSGSFSDVVQEYGGGRPPSRRAMIKSQLLAIRAYSGYIIVSRANNLKIIIRHRQCPLGGISHETTPAAQVGRCFPLARARSDNHVASAIQLIDLRSILTSHGRDSRSSLVELWGYLVPLEVWAVL